MLKAISTHTQEPVIIIDPQWSTRLQEIRDWSRERTLQCPVCHANVLLKAGNQRQWHFAHRHREDCALSHTPPEILQARQALYEWLRRKFQDASIDLEVFLPRLPRIIDCCVTHGEHRIAFVLIHQQIRKSAEREQLRQSMTEAFTYVNFLMLSTLQFDLGKDQSTINLSTTERDFLVESPYDEIERIFGERPRKETLHYLDGTTLITFRNLRRTFHSAQEHRGRKIASPLKQLLISKRGEISHLGEFETYCQWQRKQQKAREKEQGQNTTVHHSRDLPPRNSVPLRPPTENTQLLNPPSLKSTNIKFPSPSPQKYIVQFIPPSGILCLHPERFSSLEECYRAIHVARPSFHRRTQVQILDETTGEILPYV
jgi:hypothetical protein